MELILNYDILKYLHEMRSSDILDGRIQVMAELIKQGHPITLTSKQDILLKTIILTSIVELEEFIQLHLYGWKPTEYYQYI